MLKLNPREAYASNSRAELGAILETLRQNERDNLIIESDSLYLLPPSSTKLPSARLLK